MAVPSELSLAEIRKFMLKNGGKVTNHELVKHFKSFLTNPNTKGEARKRFKTCVNILSTIKNENNEKYLILRKRYFNECPVEDEPEDDLHLLGNPEYLRSPGSRSGISEYDLAPSSSNISASSFGEMQMATSSEHIKSSPYKEPPPYKPPPKVMHHAYQNQQKYGDCVDEFKSALSAIGRRQNELATGGSFDDGETIGEVVADMIPKIPTQTKPSKDDQNLSTQLMRDNALELQPPSVPSIGSNALVDGTKHDVDEDKENVGELPAPKVMNPDHVRTLDKQISVKEATKKFNRIASEEEANKITSPPAKKKPEKPLDEVNNENLVSLTGHPKSKEWLVSSARANYQELAKLSAEHPELVRLQDPTTVRRFE